MFGVPWWEYLLAALFAPGAVWILWRLQTLSVDLLRHRMLKLLRSFKWVYNTVSWFGTLLHELSHATVLLLSGHGIREFSVKTDKGHVTPRRMRQGTIGFLSFLVAALAPLFLPAALVLAGTIWLLEPSLLPTAAADVGLRPAAEALLATLVEFPIELVAALVTIDLASWQGATLFLLILVAMPGSRPSHVKASRFHSEDDEGDIAVVRKRLRQNPWPLVTFLLLVAVAYWALVPWWPKAFWVPVQTVWAVSLTGIVLSLWGALFWTLVSETGKIKRLLMWIPLVVAVAVQVMLRTVWVPGVLTDVEPLGPADMVVINITTLILVAASVVALRVVATRRF